MNSTKAVQAHDPINDPFPVSIRGNSTRPDVPPDQFVDQTFAINTTTPMRHELTPWAASAPEGAFRFRPHDEFDATGRLQVLKLREHARGTRPFKEAYLSKMNQQGCEPLSKATVMHRHIQLANSKVPWQHPTEENRDVGRRSVSSSRTKSAPEAVSNFPYSWNTQDWYEFEVAQVRMKRFEYETDVCPQTSRSEVVYKLVLGTNWDHHGKHLADDVVSFVRDIAIQLIEEKLNAVRSALLTQHVATDSELRRAFDASGQVYSDEEIFQFVKKDLLDLEADCVKILSAARSSVDSSSTSVWPTVTSLEPFRRMVEFWSCSADATFADQEFSTKKYEFRKFFKLVEIRMPFQSIEFERRMYDIRHWLHRHASVEFQTIARKNIVHDAARFPVEHDPAEPATHTSHQMYSFALDWNSAPADFARTIDVVDGDTFASVAAKLGCNEVELRSANPGVRSIGKGKLNVPRQASIKYLANPSHRVETVDASDFKNWEEAAERLGVAAEELQAANPLMFASSPETFAHGTKTLRLPSSANGVTEFEFSDRETVAAGDTIGSIASRLGTSVDDLLTANPGIRDLHKAASVAVPSSARFKRRVHHALWRSEAETAELFPTMVSERDKRALPDQLPDEPADAKKFPDEFTDALTGLPRQPLPVVGHDWLSYTTAHLDRGLTTTKAAANVPQNQAWPFQAIPGTDQQTPFEEDQTWLLHRLPSQGHEIFNPQQHLQDLPEVNNEQFAQSMERLAP